MANIFKVTHNISQVRGDDWKYTIPVKDTNNADFDWTGFTTPQSEMRRQIDDPSPVAVFTVTLETGKVILELANTSTVNIEPGTYVYDIQVIFPDLRKQTIIGGNFTVEADVTLL